MKRVLVTGASGFIAGHLSRRLSEAGFRVVGTSRTGKSEPGFEKVYNVSLGETLASVLADSPVDAVIHAANHSGADEFSINYDGTRRWFDDARSAGVGLQVLLSSLSARENAQTGYGKSKYELERLFLAANEVCFRLGVVVGDGGMFDRIRQSMSAPVVPILDNGSARVFVLGIEFLCDVIADCIERNGEDRRARIWSLQQPTPVTLRQLMETIRAAYGYRCLFVPVPSLPVLAILSLVEKLPLNLPVTSTNVRGLRQSRNDDFESDFHRFRKEEQPLSELVSTVASKAGAQE